MHNSYKGNILILGLRNFPYGLAEVQRAMLIARTMMGSGRQICFISKMNSKAYKNSLSVNGIYAEFNYVFSSKKYFSSKLLRIVNRFVNKIKEFTIIRQHAKNQNYTYAFISSNSFLGIFYYYFICKLIGIKVILNYVEYYSSIKQSNPFKSLQFKLIDRYAHKLCDGIIPISNYLLRHLEEKNIKVPVLKIPVICDMKLFNNKGKKETEPYFCYCGSTNYSDVIEYVIDGFKCLSNTAGFKLYLIINGDSNSISRITKLVLSEGLESSVNIFTELSTTEFTVILNHARALLIPLRNSIQDIARFPHKIGEYTATGNPIISNDIGEVSFYFKDGENALLSPAGNEKGLQTKMEYVINNPIQAREIGQQGKKVCENHFHYARYIDMLEDFIKEL